MSSLKSKAYKSLRWQIGSISFSAISNIGFLMVMGRLIEPESFGKFALVSVILGMTQIFAEFGFGPALIQKKELSQEHINFTFFTSVGIGFFLFILILMLAPVISDQFDGKIETSLIQFLSLNLIVSTLGITSRSLLIRDLEFDKIFWVSTISYLIGNMVIGITLAWKGFETWALLIGLIATNLLMSLLYIYHKPFKLKWAFNTDSSKDILKYGAGLTLVQLVSQMANQVDKLLLGKVSSMNLLGAFERSQRIQRLPLTYAGSSIDGILFSVMSKFSDEKEKLANFFFPFIIMLSFGTIYATIVTYFMSDTIIEILLGPGWESASSLLKILAILIFIQTFSRFGDTFVRATKIFTASAWVKIIFLSSMILFGIFGYYYAGFNGAVWGIVIGHLVHSFFMLGLCIRYTGYSKITFFKLLVPVLVFGGLFFIKNWMLFHFVEPQSVSGILLLLFSDLILLGVYFMFPVLLGKTNALFISERISEFGIFPKLAAFFRQRIRH